MVQLLKKVCRSDEACLADKDDVGMQRIDTREEMRKNNIDQMFESLHWDQKKSRHLGFQFSDFQLKLFVDPKPVELWESAPKVLSKPFCLIAKIKFEKSVQL